MSEFDGEPEPAEVDSKRFEVKEKCANHHACECKEKKLKAAEEFFESQIAAIDRNQALYTEVASKLIGVYRAFDKSYRHTLKERLKSLYDSLKDLGVGVGVSRASMPGIAEG